MSTVGIFNTSNFAKREVKPSFFSTIHKKMPRGSAPLTAIMSQVKSENISNTEITWFSERPVFPMLALAVNLPAAAPNSITQIEIVSSENIIEKMVFEIEGTFEQILVTAVMGNVVAIKRGVGTVPPSAVPAGTRAMQIGTAFEESSICPLPMSRSFESARNVTQIFRNSWGISGTATAVATQVGGDRSAKNKKDMMEYHAIDMEKSMLFGQKTETVLNGQPFRKMDGIISMIRQYAPQNIKFAGDTVTYDQFDEMTDSLFDVITDNSEANDRVIFTDKTGMKVVNDLGRNFGVLQTTMGETKFGMQFREFSTTRGNFKMVEHPLFNVYPSLVGMMLVLDLSPLIRHPLNGRDSVYKDIYVDDCQDSKGGTILTEMTISNSNLESSGVIYGMKNAACAPCRVPVSTHMAYLSCDKPCGSGEVAPGSTITLSINSAKPSQNVIVKWAGANITVTIDAAGNGTATAVVGTLPVYTFSVVPNTDGQTIWAAGVTSVCVTQPCDNGDAVNDSHGVDLVVTQAPPFVGSNPDANQGNVPQ
jgi:hypothetical protein